MIPRSLAPAANGKRNASCREVVRRALLERIGNGVLAPGERIVEARLAEEFGVSAIPVREAIRELVSMGVLAAANNRGAWVREVSLRETVDALEVKAALEAQAARSGNGTWRGDGPELQRLCTTIAQAARRRDFAEYQRHNHSFHRMIVAAADNATLLRLWDGLAFEVRTRPILEFLRVEDPLSAALEHEAIAAALLAGRRARAAALLAAHAGRLVDHLRQQMVAEQAAAMAAKPAQCKVALEFFKPDNREPSATRMNPSAYLTRSAALAAGLLQPTTALGGDDAAGRKLRCGDGAATAMEANGAEVVRYFTTKPEGPALRAKKAVLALICFFLTSITCHAEPKTVPTFHCMSLYWPCENGAVTNPCGVMFRKTGMAAWREGQALWWDATHRFYAGAVVALEAGAEYEFKLSLASGEQTIFRDKTWPERFPIIRTVTLLQGTQNQTLRITEGGTADGFVLYEAHPAGTTIDADVTGGDEADALDHGIIVEADYVIIRGLTLRNAKQHGILIRNRHDVVIEGCDISNWGRKDPRAGQRGIVQRYNNGGPLEVTFAANLANQMDCAIKGEGGATHAIERIVVQGNRIHHPRYCASSWNEGSSFFNSFHPQGAKAVCLFRPGEELPAKGNHVIRYNEFYGDREHMFYDILFDSQGSGPLQGTDAQRDIDVYGNVFRDCWDDCMELERGFGNVRVFENYFDHIFKPESGFVSESGPFYMFRNVFDHVLQPSRDYAPDTRAWTGGAFQSGNKRFYFYHNTLLCPGGDEGAGFAWAYGNDFKEINVGRGTVDDGNFTISRNNIYQTIRWPDEMNYATRRIHGGFSFDYDLYNGSLDATLPEGPAMWGRHAIQGVPIYRAGHGTGHVDRAQLDAKSPGKDQGCHLPNFNDDYEGTAPDIGAHEYGSPDRRIGVAAYRELYGVAPVAREGFSAGRRGDSLSISWQGGAVGDYVIHDAKIPRPYFANLHAPDGTQVTRNFPPIAGTDPMDHDTIHPGLWLAFGDLNGVDFWRNQGRIEHVRFVREPRLEEGRLTFAVEEKYAAMDGREICRGVNEFAFVAGRTLTPPQAGTLLLWSTTLRCADGPMAFGPQHEMGLGFRMATPLIVKGGSGRILSNHGGENEAVNWGRAGTWWDYSGTVSGRHPGILALAAADNARPVWAHARDYGFLAMNPTGPPAEAKDVPPVPFTIAAGEPLQMKFGILLHSSPAPLDAATSASALSVVLQGWNPGAAPGTTPLKQ